MRRILATLALVCPFLLKGMLDAQTHDQWIYSGNDTWDSSWNRRPLPRTGACFFKDAAYKGDRFCVKRGDRLDHLPEQFGDNISSIRLLGGARVIVFNDRHFTGGSQQLNSSVGDLRNRPFRDDHTWNNRISSIIVR
jgi:hypothetical protein